MDKDEEEEEEEEEQKWSLQSLWHLIRRINKRQGVSLTVKRCSERMGAQRRRRRTLKREERSLP